MGSDIKMRRISGCAVSLLTSSLMVLAIGDAALAAEGGGSHYLPGAAGDIFLALPPDPGFQVANVFYYQSGSLGSTLLEGQLSLDLDLDLFLNITSVTYTFEQPVLGGRFTIGAALPFGYSDIDGALTGPNGGRLGFSDDSFDLSDISITPVQLNWTTGLWSLKFSETIITPSGGYSTSNGDLVDLGRNYWSFDTVGAFTWFNPDAGTEVSVTAGIMYNTENDDTDYKTGTEFHLDAAVNQFVSPNFAIGLRGYYYDQVSGDSGSGATLGDYKSSSYAIGPGFVWIPKFGGGQLTVFGKWMHDLDADNRFESDYVTLTGAWKF